MQRAGDFADCRSGPRPSDACWLVFLPNKQPAVVALQRRLLLHGASGETLPSGALDDVVLARPAHPYANAIEAGSRTSGGPCDPPPQDELPAVKRYNATV